MSTRTNPIALSEAEKERLDTVAEEAFGTSEVPYGAIVSMLIEEYQQSDGSDTESN